MQLPPDRVVAGRYRVLGVLGRGGMAVVHEAHDQVLDRRVALKVLAGHLLDDDRSVQRFEREARAAAGLNHPNVVGVHDADSEGDIHFLVMELVEGRSLADRLRADGPLEVDAALALADQVAAALGAAHDRGLVHRDVKPSNILLTGGGAVKVADFGIARAVSSEATQTAVVMGSIPYVAPEQLQGEPGADPRSDLYALGCVLYECLTGRPPFVADTSAAVLGQHLHLDPPPVSRDRPEVGPHVDALVASLLAKDAADRPADAVDLRDRLRRVRDGDPPIAAAAAAATAAGGIDRFAPTEVVDPTGARESLDRHAPTEVVGAATAGAGVAGAAGASHTARLDDDTTSTTTTSTGAGSAGVGTLWRGSGRGIVLALLVLALIALAVWALTRPTDTTPEPVISDAPATVPATTEPAPTPDQTVPPTEATTAPAVPTEPAPTPDQTVPPTEATTAPAVPTEAPTTSAPSPAPAPTPTPTPTPTPAPTPTPTPAPTPSPEPTTAPPTTGPAPTTP